MHPWSIHHQAFSNIQGCISSFKHYGKKLHQSSCKHVCVIRFFMFMCLSCQYIQHLWLHSKRIATLILLSTIVDLRYISLVFTSVFTLFNSRLVPTYPYPQSYVLYFYVQGKWLGVVFWDSNRVGNDEYVQLSTNKNLKDQGEYVLPGPEKLG